MKTISVVTPCYNEEDNIEECYLAIKTLFEKCLPGYRREHVICDNASTDGTVAILRRIAAVDSDVKVILNARNVGPMRSNYNGVMAATGDAVVLFMPADLKIPLNSSLTWSAIGSKGSRSFMGSGRPEPKVFLCARPASSIIGS